ncbi:MAG: DNA adenine methylase [Fimbriimonadaceae bacterium]
MIRSLDLVTTLEASSSLGCTVQHLRLLIRKDKISAVKKGRDWFVDRCSLEAFQASRYAQTRSQLLTAVEQRTLFDDPRLAPVVNVATVPHRSPFRYPGGKTWLIPIARDWFARVRSQKTVLVEPFAGGGGIGLTAALEGFVSKSLLVELDPDVAVVWRVMLSSEAPELAARIRAFTCSDENVRVALGTSPTCELDYAFVTLLRNRVSRGGILAPGAGLVKQGEANRGIASRWYPETLAKRIEAIFENRHRLDFVEDDGLCVLQSSAPNDCAAYFIDPPYPVAGKRLYRCHELDHRRLFELMATLRGPFLTTYDDNADIQALADEFGFESKLIPMKSTHHTRKLELVISRDLSWLNSAEALSAPSADKAAYS